MSADPRRRIANSSIFGSHAASLWLCGCDRFPVESQLLSLSRFTEQIPSEGKIMEDGPNHGSAPSHRGTAEPPGSCVRVNGAVQKPRSRESNPSTYSSLGNVCNELHGVDGRRRLRRLQSAAWADCDLCLLPGAWKFSIPHTDSSSALQSQEIKIPAHFLELSALLRKEHGKRCLFCAYRNPSQIRVFS